MPHRVCRPTQPLKGPHLLVEALALLPRDLQVELDIIGRSESDYEQRLLERAAELASPIRFD